LTKNALSSRFSLPSTFDWQCGVKSVFDVGNKEVSNATRKKIEVQDQIKKP
jgi:hypothetical protein